jgi:hypothetical protein
MRTLQKIFRLRNQFSDVFMKARLGEADRNAAQQMLQHREELRHGPFSPGHP